MEKKTNKKAKAAMAEALQELPEGTFSGRIFALDKKIYRHH